MIDDNTKDVLVAAMAVLTPFVVWLIGRQAKKSADKAVVAAERVEETLAISTADATQRLDSIHVLVNSRLTEALAKIDRLEARLYDITGEAPTGEPPP